jgi:lysophospholipase L1-like esterase
VRFADRGGWFTCEIIFKCEHDGHYGFAGVSTRSPAGGTSRWRTAKQGFGSSVSRFELWYATQPKGGKFQVKVDGEVVRVVDTAAEELGEGVETILVEDGQHGFEVRAIGGGPARGYGVVLERDRPGVVWDELSLIGSFTQRLDYQDPEHIARQVRRREVDLMVFMFGGNDVQRQKMDLYRTMQPYEDEYAAVIKKFRAGKPEASCLIMSLVDHGKRVGKYGIETLRIVPQLVESQRTVARESGCAFFDTFQAMGGKGSIGRWYHADPRLANADFAHPTVKGQEVIGQLFTQALLSSYVDFRKARVGEPLPELSRKSEHLDAEGKPLPDPKPDSDKEGHSKSGDAGARP